MSAVDPLVGREAALAVLHAALAAAAGGQGRTVLLAGEPGIGKTALARRVARQAADDGASVLWGQCWDGDGAPAYWPWVQVLRRADPDALGEAARILPELAEEAGSGDAEAARFRLFDAVVQTLARLAEHEPVVVVLDDLQWADEPSLLLLEFAVRHLQASPVLLLGTYRDVEAGDRLLRVAGSGAEVVALHGLPAPHVGALMAVVTGCEPPAEEAADVWRRTGGNPFFVRELSRLLTAGGPRPVGGVAHVLVDSVRDTLERRLARLTQPCADLLAVAAVGGSAVRPEVLARVAGDVGVVDLLDEAATARVLVPPSAPAAPYRFAHDLFRETIIAGMASSTKAALHLRIGRALEGLDADRAGAAGGAVHPAELAVHFVAAATGGGPAAADAADAAVRYSVRAAEDAAKRLAYEQAAAHHARALHALDVTSPPDPNTRLAIMLGLADAANHAGSDEARSRYLHAGDLARRLGDFPGLARAALGLHSLGARSDTAHAEHIALLRESVEGLTGAAAGLRARTLAALARELHHSSHAAPQVATQARAAAADAVALAREGGDPATLAFCLLALHDATWVRGSAHDRLPVVEEMLHAATAADDRDLQAQARLLLATALLELGEADARSELAEYCALADSLGHARGRWGAVSRRATLAIIAGGLDEAEARCGEALELGRRIGEPDALGVYATQQITLSVFGRGRPLPHESLPHPALVLVIGALDQLRAGAVEAARGTLAGFTVDQLPAIHDLEALTIASVALAGAGADDARGRAYDRMAAFAGVHVVVGGCATYFGAVNHHLGVLAAALDRHAEAATHFTDAAAMHEALGAVAWAELSRAGLQRLTTTSAAAEQVFRREGAVWTLTYAGTSVHLPDAKGLRDIAALLANPGQPIPALQLLSGQPVPPAGSDPVLDDRARAAYRARLAQLDAEIDEADRHHDPVRAERARAEKDALVTELSAALGLGGRRRRLGDDSERARKAVTARIWDAVARIDKQHPQLAAHLRNSLNTGASSVYDPSEPSRWTL